MDIAGRFACGCPATYILLTGKSGYLDRWEAADNRFEQVSARLGKWISTQVEKRIHNAYQVVEQLEMEELFGTFAEGCGFYKVVWLFFAGAFLGDITETIFCRITAGVWMSRSSVVWGPFSIVWGLAIALVTAMLYKYRNRSEGFLFLAGTFLGGAYEYFCSVFTEMVFGTVFWDYSEMPLNIGGRTNVLFCFFWGVLAVVWIKMIYPPMSKGIESLPALAGKIATWIVVFVMACNALLTSSAMLRYSTRPIQPEPANAFEEFIDRQYGDARMEARWPNMIVTGSAQP